MDVIVLPLSIDQFWDAYLSDTAPYLWMALVRDQEDEILRLTNWTSPNAGFETVGENNLVSI